MLLQNPDGLLFRKATALHALVLVMGQSELQPGLSPRGNVNATEPANHHALPAAMGTQATGKTPLKQNEGRALKEISYPHIPCGEARNVEQKSFIVAPTNP
jgi:hypothetical protein